MERFNTYVQDYFNKIGPKLFESTIFYQDNMHTTGIEQLLDDLDEIIMEEQERIEKEGGDPTQKMRNYMDMVIRQRIMNIFLICLVFFLLMHMLL